MSHSRLLSSITRSPVTITGAALLMLATLGAAAASAGSYSSGALQSHRQNAPVLPAHVFSPYFEAFSADSPATVAKDSGAKYPVLAFVQTPSAGSCQLDWNGNPATPIAPSTYGSDIAAIRRAGGNVVPSFGGFTADTTDTEIADSCTSVPDIAAAYEHVITTYGVTRLDMDVEADSLTNTPGVDRRNQAIAMVEQWARHTGRTVQFVYTLPTFVTGLTAPGIAVLTSAIKFHARVDIVNILTFDYFDNQPHEMGADTITAAGNLFKQLHQLYPHKSAHRLWAMVGVTDMVGIDDFGPAETFTLADATTVENWAAATRIGELSFWALERDNGNCPGTKGANSCSGIDQSTWQFTRQFIPFTRH